MVNPYHISLRVSHELAPYKFYCIQNRGKLAVCDGGNIYSHQEGGWLLLVIDCSLKPARALYPEASLSSICLVSELGSQLVSQRTSCGKRQTQAAG